MDIDMSALRALEREKEISFATLVEAIEAGAAHRLPAHRGPPADRAGRARAQERSRHRVGGRDRRRGHRAPRVRRHPDRVRPHRRHHGQAGHPAAAARRRGRADVRRVRRPRGRHRLRRDPAGQGPAQRLRRPRQDRGGAAAARAGAGRELRARHPAALLRRAGAQGHARAVDHALPHPPQPGAQAVRPRGARDRRRHGRDRRDRPRGRAPHEDRGEVQPARASTPRAPASGRWARGRAP